MDMYVKRKYFTKDIFVQAHIMGDYVEYWCGIDNYGIMLLCFGVSTEDVVDGMFFDFDFSVYVQDMIAKYFETEYSF